MGKLLRAEASENMSSGVHPFFVLGSFSLSAGMLYEDIKQDLSARALILQPKILQEEHLNLGVYRKCSCGLA